MHRRNGERMGGNGKPTREAEEREEWRCSYKDYRPWQDGAAADACVGVRITCINSPGGRVRKWGKFHGGRAVVESFRGMKNVPGWRDVGSGTSQWRTTPSRIRNSNGDRLAVADRCFSVSREQAFTLPPGLTSSFGYVRHTPARKWGRQVIGCYVV